MKVAVEDFLKGQRKAGTFVFAEKIISEVAIDAKEPKKGEPVKTFVLSPTGGEIHRGESVVDRLSKPETLREKIARFDRLSARVCQDRQYLAQIGGEMLSPDDDNPDDFDFEDGEYVDDFGDIVVTPTNPVVNPVESGDVEGEKAAATQSPAAEQPITEPDETVVE